MDLQEIKSALDQSNQQIEKWMNETRENEIQLQTQMNRLEKTGLMHVNRAGDATGRPLFPSLKAIESRTMSIDQDTLGGYLVPPDAPVWFDRLRAVNVVMRAEPFVVQMASDSLPIPHLVTSTTVGVVGEGDPITASDLTVALGSVFARKFGAYTVATSELLADSNPAARGLIAQDHLAQLGNGLDQQMLEGKGRARAFAVDCRRWIPSRVRSPSARSLDLCQ